MNSQVTASYEVVYNTLKRRILHLELVPGAVVSEIETAKEFSVSRTPVRDAFKALIGEGLLEVKPHIGTFVTLINLTKISDILYIREIVEKAVLHELALSFHQSHEFKLNHILHNQKLILDNILLSNQIFAMEFVRSDNEFHQILFKLAGRENLIHYYETINGHYERFRTFLNFEDRSSANKLYEQHLQLIDHLKNKEFTQLNQLLTRHIYDGFNCKTNVIYEHPEYFLAPE